MNKDKISTVLLAYTFFCLMALQSVCGKTYYVATSGKDSNPGTLTQPFATIQKAAGLLMPGDSVVIRGGIYRESIHPARGGISETQRITYAAYPGDTPVVKGSVQINNWINYSNNLWKLNLPGQYFGDFNPYLSHISGDWLHQGLVNHLGDVYLNGETLRECFTLNELRGKPKSWFVATWYNSPGHVTSSIYANFGEGVDPNNELAEIVKHGSLFSPDSVGADFITIDGLTLMQSASNWAGNNTSQRGLISTKGGSHWIIQNCTIRNAKCAGIACSPENKKYAGYHIIRNNIIERCGQTGISSHNGLFAGLVEGNLIQDINYMGQFGGAESAGIKVHFAIDLIVKNNIIRRLYDHTQDGPTSIFGIWLDWAGQGSRVTGNIVYDIYYTGGYRNSIYFERCHGPILCDNNICMGIDMANNSERVIYAHNLFVNSGIYYFDIYADTRRSQYWEPHTRNHAGTDQCIFTGDRYFNNLFFGGGATFASVQKTADFKAGTNVYYNGASRLPWDSSAIVADKFNPNFIHKDLPNGVALSFYVTDEAIAMKCPLVDYGFIGKYSIVNQGIETHDGTPVTINTDCFGNTHIGKNPMVGPFGSLKAGPNTFTIVAGPKAPAGKGAVKNGIRR